MTHRFLNSAVISTGNWWCFPDEYRSALLVLRNNRTHLCGEAFNILMSFLQHRICYSVTALPGPEPEIPLADFNAAFGIRDLGTQTKDDSDDCSDDYSDEVPGLPPRMAYELMESASWLGDNMDDDEGFFLPRIARRHLRRSASWRRSFQQCYFRIYWRLRRGQMPKPNCTGEEMALHTMFDYVEDDEHPNSKYDSNDIYWTLQKHPNDEDYEMAKEQTDVFEDHDVLGLFKDEGDSSSSDGRGDTDTDDADLIQTHHKLDFMKGPIGRVFAYGPMHPKEWFEPFRNERFWADAEHLSLKL